MNDPRQLELVYRSSSAKECRERSLVLSAAGVNHHVYRHAGADPQIRMAKQVLTDLIRQRRRNEDKLQTPAKPTLYLQP